jgi:hypothetical protein
MERRTLIKPLAERPASPHPDEVYTAMRSKVQIDRHKLDNCIEEQPQSFLEVADQYAYAKDAHDSAKDALTQTDARLASEIRRACETASERATKDLVDDRVVQHKEHKAAVEAVNRARLQMDLWGGLKEAMQQRKSMLSEMVSLYLAAYFSGNEATKNQKRDADAANIRAEMALKRHDRNRG